MKTLMCLAPMALASLASQSAQSLVPCVHEARFELAGLARVSVTGRSQVVENPLEIYGFNPQPEPPVGPAIMLRKSERKSVFQMRDQF